MTENFLATTLCKKGNLISLQLFDGTKLEGVITEVSEDAIRLTTQEDEAVELTPALLKSLTYLYVGFSTNQKEVMMPIQIKANGIITKMNNMAMVKGERGKYMIKEHSQAGPTQEQLREGDRVLFVIKDSSAYILPDDTLDNTLRKVVSLANAGETGLAMLFLEELVKQFPEYEDLPEVLSDIRMQDGQRIPRPTNPNVVQQVQSLPAAQEDYLSARGYITQYNRQNPMGGELIDVDSHQKLRFYIEDSYGELKQDRPVTYTIFKDKNKFIAKTVLPLMSIEKARKLAWYLYNNRKQRTACDVLRIALKEAENDQIKDLFDEWIEEEARNKRHLWKEEALPTYQVPTQPEPLAYDFTHTETQLVSDPPEAPTIRFAKEVEQEAQSTTANAEENKAHEETPPATDTATVTTVKLTTEPEQAIEDDLTSITDTVIEESLMAEETVPANGSMTFRLYVGTGGTIRSNSAARELYYCFMDDIIDKELYEKAMNSNGTQYIREEPVVCLFQDSGKAIAISRPETVATMLKRARDLYLKATANNNDDDETTNNQLLQLKMALGYTSHVERFAPLNPLTSQISSSIRSALKRLSANSYKAPAGSLKYTGYVMNTKEKKLEDVRFKESKRPKFTEEDVVDPDYLMSGINVGDELMYSVYYYDKSQNKSQNPPHARFVHRAMSESQLIALAREWERKGNILNAWGVAKNIADANPDSEAANSLIEKYENMTTDDGAYLISDTEKSGRQEPIAQSFLKQAIQAQEQQQYSEAIEYYKAALLDEATEHKHKAKCVENIINIYSMLYRADPTRDDLYREYLEFGRSHLEGTEESHYVRSQSRILLTTIRIKIIYYLDMGETQKLLETYDKGIELIDKEILSNKNAETEVLNNEKAEWWAWKAWIQLRQDQNGYADARRWAESALGIRGDQEMAKLCMAVCDWRQHRDTEIKEKAKFTPYQIKDLENWTNKSQAVYYQRGNKNNLAKERFALLCRILKSPDNSLSYLARYLGTLIYNEEEYYHDLQSNGTTLPADCWVAQHLFHCIKKGVSWPDWQNVRLLSMLEVNSAYLICSMLYQLDPAFARDLTVSWDKDFKHEQIYKQTFAKYFSRWRGTDFQGLYTRILNDTEEAINTNTIVNYANFIGSLGREEWMIQEDRELISNLRQQLPAKLKEYEEAVTSRIIIESRERINSDLDDSIKRINRRPTVLSLTAFHPLLTSIQEAINENFAHRQFSPPHPVATLLSASSVDENGDMIIEVEVRNDHQFAYAMSDYRLKVSDKTIGLKQTGEAQYYSLTIHNLYGNEKEVFVIPVKLEAQMKAQESGQLFLDFSYKSNNEEASCLFEITYPISAIPLQIKNIITYGSEAEGDLFCGRDKYIAEVLSIIRREGATPHFFIYGQKRCGKTSVLHRIKEQLQQDEQFVIVEANFFGYGVKCENDIYFYVIVDTLRSLQRYNRAARRSGLQVLELFKQPPKESTTYNSFIDTILSVKESMAETSGWEKRKLIFLIDEFTEAYNWFKTNKIEAQFLLRWKSLIDRGLFYAVIVAQDVLGSFMKDTGENNAFQMFERQRLTYLEKNEATELVNRLTKASTGKDDLYVEDAIDRILYYSANSAYYTRWICKFIIDRVEKYRLTRITVADVEIAVRDALQSEGEETIGNYFDPLTFAGTKPEYSKPTKDEAFAILNQIAEANNPDEGCFMQPNDIIDTLLERDVLKPNEQRSNYYIIKVKMFILWIRMKKMRSTIGS